MQISLNWLKRYVDLNQNPQEISKALTSLGFEVESLSVRGEGLQNVVVGEVRADRVDVLGVHGAGYGNPPETELGSVPGYDYASWIGLLAPAKTPPTVIHRLNHEIVRVLALSDVKAEFNNVGIEPVGSTPAQLAATMKSEMERVGKTLKAAGIRAE